MDGLVFVANFIYVAAYFTNNILRVRCLTVTAATCLAIFFYAQPQPMLTIVGWNLFFVALNLVQIARLLRVRNRLV
jgi:uncharacterized membrane protein